MPDERRLRLSSFPAPDGAIGREYPSGGTASTGADERAAPAAAPRTRIEGTRHGLRADRCAAPQSVRCIGPRHCRVCSGRLGRDERVPRHGWPVAGHDGRMHVGFEGLKAAPSTPTESEASLEKGDDTFDAGSKGAQLPVNPGGLDHILDLQAAGLWKTTSSTPNSLMAARLWREAKPPSKHACHGTFPYRSR